MSYKKIENLIKNFCDAQRSEVKTTPQMDERVLTGALSAHKESKQTQPADIQQNIWRTIMKTKITKLAAAAVIIIAVFVGINSFFGTGASVAWGGILECIQAANTVSYKVTSQVENEPERVSHVMFISPNLLRKQVLPDGNINIHNYRERKRLTIRPENKTASVLEYINVTQNADDLPIDIKRYFERHLWEYFRPDYEESSEFIGNEKIDGHLADIFTAKHKRGQIKVWADRITGLPIRAEISSRGLGGDDMGNFHNGIPLTYVLSDFVWDGYIDESLFSIEVPVGYKTKQHKIDVSEPTEKAMIDSLTVCAQLSDGIFPTRFKEKTLTKIWKDSMKREAGGKPLTQDKQAALYQNILKMKAGFDFVSKLKDHNDWQYFGDGIKLGDSEVVICWWRPDDSEFYRVIYGDLSVEDVAPEDLPK